MYRISGSRLVCRPHIVCRRIRLITSIMTSRLIMRNRLVCRFITSVMTNRLIMTWLIIRYWMRTLISLRFNFEIARNFRNGMAISNHRTPPRSINIGSSSANSCSKPYTIKVSMAISLDNTNDSTIRQTAYYHMVITKLEFSSTLATKCSDPIARKLSCSSTLEESFPSAAEFCRAGAFNCCGHWVFSSWLNISFVILWYILRLYCYRFHIRLRLNILMLWLNIIMLWLSILKLRFNILMLSNLV